MTARTYFSGLYDASVDPWRLATTEYELDKFAATVEALPRPRYESAYEPGCSVGVLTRLLAPRCDHLLAMDLDARPLAQIDVPNVRTQAGAVPADWPGETFDLAVLSELLYFLDAGDRAGVLDRLTATVRAGGDIVAVHWRHPFDEADATGDEVHAELADLDGFTRISSDVRRDFRLEVFRRD